MPLLTLRNHQKCEDTLVCKPRFITLDVIVELLQRWFLYHPLSVFTLFQPLPTEIVGARIGGPSPLEMTLEESLTQMLLK